MAQDQPKDWREKYLDLVEVQESQQQQFDNQLEQMRRALVRVSLAADGVDPELDNVLAALREHLKTPEKHHQLNQRLAVVEEALIAFDERKESLQTHLHQILDTMIDQLRELNLSRPINKGCKSLQKNLKNRLENQQELTQVLYELAALQAQAFQQNNTDKPGLIQKFLSGRDRSADAAEDDGGSTNDVEDHGQVSETFVAGLGAVLREIVELIEANHSNREILEQLIRQLGEGLSAAQLPTFLQQLHELIRLTVADVNQEFEVFLLKTNDQLQSISQILNHAAHAANEQSERHQQLYSTMGNQLQTLQTTVAEASDLEQLKGQVNIQLETIRNKIAEAEKKPNSLSEQLKQVLDQVEQFEQEAKATSECLTQQQQKAQTDPMTGLANREAYNERCKAEKVRWQRYQHDLTMAVLDIDHFKGINDNYGHLAGDKVLKLIARSLQKRLRKSDFIARYGGEEFVILLPETNVKQAQNVVEKIRRAIAATPFHFRKQPVQITLSAGLSEFVEGDNEASAFARADKALYRAKNNGRNQCAVG